MMEAVREPDIDFLKIELIRLLNEDQDIPYRRVLLKSHFERLLGLMDSQLLPPYEVEIQPSYACNAKCRHCYSILTAEGTGRLEDRLMDKGNLYTVLGKILEWEVNGFGVDTIKFVGTTGDPLMNPHTPSAVEVSKAAGKAVIVFTNGIGFKYTSPDGTPFVEKLALADKINLSLDAGSDEILCRVKGAHLKGEFYSIINNFRKIRDLNPDILMQASFVVSEHNYNDIALACRLIKETGANRIIYRRNMICSDAIDQSRKELTAYLLEQAKEYEDGSFKVVEAHSRDEQVSDLGTEHFRSKSNCYLPLIWMVIASDGSVVPCGHRGCDFGWNYGNVLEQDINTILSNMHQSSVRLPDHDCRVCSPFPRSINPFLEYVFANREKPGFKDALYGVRELL